MAAVPTVEIHNPKDSSQKWIINAGDYSPEKHVLWGMVKAQDAPVAEPVQERQHTPMQPSVPDFVMDDDGNITHVNVINPHQRNARLEIPYGDYDPDSHELWSSHSRFQ